MNDHGQCHGRPWASVVIPWQCHSHSRKYHGNAMISHGNTMAMPLSSVAMPWLPMAMPRSSMAFHGSPWSCVDDPMGMPMVMPRAVQRIYGRECLAWFCFRAAEADPPTPSTCTSSMLATSCMCTGGGCVSGFLENSYLTSDC